MCYYLEKKFDIEKGVDVVKWWQVCFHFTYSLLSLLTMQQDHAKEYLTLAWITLDILAIQVLSVPCEHLFSMGKHIAMTDMHTLALTALRTYRL